MFDNNIFLQSDPNKCSVEDLQLQYLALGSLEPSDKSELKTQWILARAATISALTRKWNPALEMIKSLSYMPKYQNANFRIVGGLVVAYPKEHDWLRAQAKVQIWLIERGMTGEDALDWIVDHIDRHRSTKFEKSMLIDLV